MLQQHATLLSAMVAFDRGDAKRIQHFVKVYAFAATIAANENLDPATTFVLETAAILHDIGIHPSEALYGDCSGKHQEELGPGKARELLTSLGTYTPQEINRVCFLIARHHTYTNVEGLDWQILLEADFLVNSFEDNMDKQAVCRFRDKVFKTASGKRLLNTMWGL